MLRHLPQHLCSQYGYQMLLKTSSISSIIHMLKHLVTHTSTRAPIHYDSIVTTVTMGCTTVLGKSFEELLHTLVLRSWWCKTSSRESWDIMGAPATLLLSLLCKPKLDNIDNTAGSTIRKSLTFPFRKSYYNRPTGTRFISDPQYTGSGEIQSMDKCGSNLQ